jgi:transcription-repair coupling factor (superfamily II helicase)
VIDHIVTAKAPLTLSGAQPGFLPWLMTDLARAAATRAVYIAADDAAMRAMAETAAYFAPEVEVILFPAWDCLPYDRASPSLRATSERLFALAALQAKPKQPQLILTTVNAVTQRVLTRFRIRQLTARLERGTRIDLQRLSEMLTANGYVRTDSVADAGEFAVRGGLVDLFPSGEPHGIRLDFFGDEIETVRSFDPADQRTIAKMDGFTLLPASEALLDEAGIKRFRSRYREMFGATATGDPVYQAVSEGRRLSGMDHWLPLIEERMETLFDHIGEGALIVRDAGVESAAQARFDAVTDYHDNRQAAISAEPGSYRPIAADALYLTPKEWRGQIKSWPIHLATPFREPPSDSVIDFSIDPPRDFTPERTKGDNIYDAVAGHCTGLAHGGKGLIIACYSIGSRERLRGLFADHAMTDLSLVETWQEAQGIASMKRTALIVLALDNGFTTDRFAVLTEQDMLGDRLVRRAKRKKSADAFLAELASLTPGDLVVHNEHGIGRYEGLTQIPVSKAPHDCVALSYAGGDKLYVPVENIDVLSRYGSESDGVALDRLGGEAWQRRKARMKERIREIAGELIGIAAERALKSGAVAEVDGASYSEFCTRFPYQETDDQDRAIDDVLTDLAVGKPMDRLVVGDVGFGKTEIALRAAFVAAMSGMQVAIVCPTTLLARQHYNNFVERFAGFPLRIGRLSRLVNTAEAKATREGLEDGRMDIVIGTHALLAKSISFKRLGLVIVDEEQRFGVVHKEKLKSLKVDVHVLTLTATPIPRTLQMAMSGLRELSVIQTPPVDRLTVRTYVMPWDKMVIREALLREHYRGGQSFFVTPRISDLGEIEEFLRTEVPEVNYVVAHGQMAAGDVEDRISAFYDKRYDVLISTTIIESGIDIPSANTLIIHRADRFGLAQLYQLRGRVGRSKTRAYAYMTTTPNRMMTATAEKRLKVLSDLDSLGAGFQLASHDLDIRGAGNLLGDEQSGHIREVGFELYQSMLEDAIMDARAGGMARESVRDLSPQITTDAAVMIPDTYVPDLDLRMGLYRRVNELENAGEIEAFAAEMIDRFGALPDATANLLTLIQIKIYAKKAHIAKIDLGPRGALISFWQDRFPNVEGLLAYVKRVGDIAKLRPDMRLSVTRAWATPEARLNGALQLSKGLAQAAGQ